MEIITKNGQKEVVINAASFQNASNLRKAVMKSIIESDFTKGLDKAALESLNFTSLLDIGLKLIFNADSSNSFEKALFECLKDCYIDEDGIKNKITALLFDEKPELREDYYEIVSKCCEENLRPFFKSLVSEFQARMNQLGTSQKSA